MKKYILKITFFIFLCLTAESIFSQTGCDVSGSEIGSAAWSCNVNYQARFDASYYEYMSASSTCSEIFIECATESTGELMNDLTSIDQSYTSGDITFEQWESLFNAAMDYFDSSLNDCFGGGIDQTSGWGGCMDLATGYYVDDLIADAESRNLCYCLNVSGCTEYCD